ncbi:MAG: ATP-binding cassette domain-containing protein [Planctomycetaceae bacterium]|nr:ATP-binding cassette domain-containing protein [Planctomycetaceae bacterium]
MSETLVKVEHVSKKFCRSLKRSLWYGMKDVAHSLNPWAKSSAENDSPQQDSVLRVDEFWALRDISFEVRRGECLGLIGHNGAGKSTLLKILNGLNRPDAGRITMRGRVAAMIELGAGFNPILTGRENIFTQAALLGFTPEEIRLRFDAIVEFSELEDFLDMPLQNYSSGMKVRLGFSVYSQLCPDILIIDEVLAVGDVAFRLKCLNAIGEMMKSSAVIFVSHSMPQIFRVCRKLIVLDRGKTVYSGGDISAGVSRYLDLAETGEPSVTGSGEATVRHVRASSNQRAVEAGETLTISHGDELVIEAGIAAPPAASDISIEILLWNAEMIPVMELVTSSLSSFPLVVDETGLARSRARLHRTELGPGKYSVTIVITNADNSRVYCRHDNLVYLCVEADAPSGASVLATADWSQPA